MIAPVTCALEHTHTHALSNYPIRLAAASFVASLSLHSLLSWTRLEADLMERVRSVGESYELNKYKTLNKTIELDARLANERLLATKLRLSQVNAANEKLAKELRSAQAQFRDQEKRLLLAETMLRQLTANAATATAATAQSPIAFGSGAGAWHHQSGEPQAKPKRQSLVRRARQHISGGAGASGRRRAPKQTSRAMTTATQRATSGSRLQAGEIDELAAAGAVEEPLPARRGLKSRLERSRSEAEALDASSFGQAKQQAADLATTTEPPTGERRTVAKRGLIRELRHRLNLAVGARTQQQQQQPSNRPGEFLSFLWTLASKQRSSLMIMMLMSDPNQTDRTVSMRRDGRGRSAGDQRRA